MCLGKLIDSCYWVAHRYKHQLKVRGMHREGQIWNWQVDSSRRKLLSFASKGNACLQR